MSRHKTRFLYRSGDFTSEQQEVVIGICAIRMAATGFCDPVRLWKWAWLTVLLRILQKSHKVTVEFRHNHRVTEIFSVHSQGHNQILGGHKLSQL